MQTKKRILVAPLNLGLGHATRCIPIIEALENHGFEPVIASDGAALALLRKEFSHLQTIELPAYPVDYTKKDTIFRPKLLIEMPRMLNAVHCERKIVQQLIKDHTLHGIISDNRPGAFSKAVPSIFITHRLNVIGGNTTQIYSRIQNYYIKKYCECWVPDVKTVPNLSGKLGHSEDSTLNLKYIGPVSRLHKTIVQKKYDLMVLLSGPEPHRSLLEEKLTRELEYFNGTVLFVRGCIEPQEKITEKGNITFYNFMNTAALENAFCESDMVLCRSGYSTIMDLAKLGKKAFFIPTPGNGEQEYLAKKLKKSGLAPYATQNSFKVDDLQKVDLYKGLKHLNGAAKWKDLFSLFEGK